MDKATMHMYYMYIHAVYVVISSEIHIMISVVQFEAKAESYVGRWEREQSLICGFRTSWCAMLLDFSNSLVHLVSLIFEVVSVVNILLMVHSM